MDFNEAYELAKNALNNNGAKNIKSILDYDSLWVFIGEFDYYFDNLPVVISKNNEFEPMYMNEHIKNYIKDKSCSEIAMIEAS